MWKTIKKNYNFVIKKWDKCKKIAFISLFYKENVIKYVYYIDVKEILQFKIIYWQGVK